MSLERYLQEIAVEDKPLRHGTLVALSDLTREELAQFARVWERLSAARQRWLIRRLVETAEDNVEFDYQSICLMCLDSPDPEVRETAIQGLWEYEDRCVMSKLLDMLISDVSPKVRGAAATALGKFSLLAGEGKLSSRQAERLKEALVQILENEKECIEVRRRVLEAAAPFDTHMVREYIQRAYESDETELRSSALYAMGRTGDSYWLLYLFKELRSASAALRYEAANACGELGDESAVPHLVPLLEDDDPEVQLAAIHALGEIGGATASRALRRCTRSNDPPLREAALEALENLETLEDPLAFRYSP